MIARRMSRVLVAVMLTGSILVPACEKDPNEPETWIDKLDDNTEVDEAVRNLGRLKDPKAIKPLGKLWKKLNKPSTVLRVIINIAATPDPKTKAPHYEDAIPFLVEAVEGFESGVERSVDDATVACDALGRAHDPSTVGVLIAAVERPMPKLSPANRVRVAAVRALGKFKNPKAVDLLIKILNTDPKDQRLQLNAAAALALAETGDPKALPALTQALFIGPIFQQVRQGITRIGKPTEQAMLALLENKDPAIVEYAKLKNFEKNAPGSVPYMGAMILGDLRARAAVPHLAAGLKTEARPSFIDQKTGAPGPSTHAAYLDALRRIGDASAAPAVYEFWTNPKTDDSIRPIAIDVYSMLALDNKALPALLTFIRDTEQEPQIRFASILAYGRLARSAADAKPIDELIAGFEAKVAAAEAKGKAAKSPLDKDTAEGEKQEAMQWRDTLKETSYRMEIAIKCGADPKCYADALGGKDVSIGQPGLPRAERALLELRKMGEKARPVLDTLLKYVDSSERMIREGVLLALPQIAALPCKTCSDKLIKVIESQAQQTTLDQLNTETRIVYHWFLWAGT
jgi:HEAT repeat protein